MVLSIKGLQSRFALEDVKELVGVVHAGCIRGELSLPPSRPSPPERLGCSSETERIMGDTWSSEEVLWFRWVLGWAMIKPDSDAEIRRESSAEEGCHPWLLAP